MTSQDQFEAWAAENLPTLYLTKTDQGTYESTATGSFFAAWSARDGEIERLQRDRTDWQAACLKRGFTYCREPDDHYVLADVPEMAALLGEVLGVEVRDRENDSYGETVSDLKDQVDAGIDAFHRAYQAETERDQLKATVSDYEMGLEAAKEEIARLKGENEGLFAIANLRDLLPDLDEALEDLEVHGQHGDQGYRKLKDWYRKVALKCKAIDAANGGVEPDLVSQNEWLRRQLESIAGQHAPLEPIPDEDGWSRKLPGYDLVSLLRDAERYRWLERNVKDKAMGTLNEYVTDWRRRYSFPLLLSQSSVCSPITLSEAIDAAMSKESQS